MIARTARLAVAGWLLLSLTVLALGALVWMRPGTILPLRRRALAGFEMGLPPGKYVARPLPVYRSDDLAVHTWFDRLFINVSWEPGSLEDEKGMRMMAEGLARLVDAPSSAVRRDVVVAAPDGRPTRSWTMPLGGRGLAWGTVVACGGRRITVQTAGATGDLERMHRRIVATLRCRPDQAQEAKLSDIPLVVELPAGWSRLDGDPGTLALTDRRYLFLAFTAPGKVSEEAAPMVVSALLGGEFAVGARQGSDWPFDSKTAGKLPPGWVSIRYCASLDLSLVVVATYRPEGSSQTARELLGKARCRRPGERPQTWPLLDGASR